MDRVHRQGAWNKGIEYTYKRTWISASTFSRRYLDINIDALHIFGTHGVVRMNDSPRWLDKAVSRV